MSAFQVSEKILHFVTEFREKIEPCWDDVTRHPYMMPVPADRPNSYGQCWQSSIILLDELEKNFPEEPFKLVRGVVLQLGETGLRAVIEAHAWINWELRKHEDACPIDVTGDQAGSGILPPVVVEPYLTLAQSEIVYLTTGSCGTLHEATQKLSQRELGKKLLGQAAILKQRYQDTSYRDLSDL